MSDFLSFKAKLLSGLHTCEKCGKQDENANRVIIKRGNKIEERTLCLSCTVKVKQNVEKMNLFVKDSSVSKCKADQIDKESNVAFDNDSNRESDKNIKASTPENLQPNNAEINENIIEPLKKESSRKATVPIIVFSLFVPPDKLFI